MDNSDDEKIVLETNSEHVSAYSSSPISYFGGGGLAVKIGGIALAAILTFVPTLFGERKVDIPECLVSSIVEEVNSPYEDKVTKRRASQTKELELDLSWGYEFKKGESLEFLEDFKRLKELEIEVDSDGIEYLNMIPEHNNLKKLTFSFHDISQITEGNLQFFEKFPNLKHLILKESNIIFPGHFIKIIERYQSDIEVLELDYANNCRWGFNLDFLKLFQLKELKFHNLHEEDDAYEGLNAFIPSFSRNDYQSLIDAGVKIDFGELSMERIEQKWEWYEQHYKNANVEMYDTEIEKINAISLYILNNDFGDPNMFQALTHMAGMRSVRTTAFRDGWPYDCVLLAPFGDNNYYFFGDADSQKLKEELFLALQTGREVEGIDGYMQPLDSLTDWNLSGCASFLKTNSETPKTK